MLDGETESVLTLKDVVPSDADSYTVAVSNGGRVESNHISATVVQPISIVSQPTGGNAILNERFELSVVASGTEPITYQWFLDGIKVSGATEREYGIEKVNVSDTGQYHVEVRNHAGVVVSQKIEVNVLSPPIITLSSKSLSAVESDGM